MPGWCMGLAFGEHSKVPLVPVSSSLVVRLEHPRGVQPHRLSRVNVAAPSPAQPCPALGEEVRVSVGVGMKHHPVIGTDFTMEGSSEINSVVMKEPSWL